MIPQYNECCYDVNHQPWRGPQEEDGPIQVVQIILDSKRGTCWCQGDEKTIASPCMTSVLKFDVATSHVIQTSGLYIVLFIKKSWGRWWYLQLKLLGYLRGLNSISGMRITTYFMMSKIPNKCLQSTGESPNRISKYVPGVSISQGLWVNTNKKSCH